MEGYKSYFVIPSFDEYAEENARVIFDSYLKKGVILSSNYDDNKWYLSNELVTKCFSFEISEYKLGEYLKLDKEDFIKYFKIFIAFRLGKYDLAYIGQLILCIKKVISSSIDMIEQLSKDTPCVFQSRNIIDFFSMLPDEGRSEELSFLFAELECLEESYYCMDSFNEQRMLASFDSYFSFDMLINRFWDSCSKEDKLFYFPLWLWWNLTTIIPTRATEFLLTPRNCLSSVDGKYFITLKKTGLKGGHKTIHYNINEDYKEYKFEIPNEIANTITWYIKETDACYTNKYNALFCVATHAKHFERFSKKENACYTRNCLNTVLRHFYKDIIEGKYGYKILVSKSAARLNLNDKEIQYIDIGDTRHLAMINLIASDVPATTAQILAGHHDIDMSSHYFSNISKMIKCRIRTQYTKQLSNRISSHSLSLPKKKINKGEYTEIDKGKCYSPTVKDRTFEDCKNAVGDNATIGVCEKCDFFVPDGTTFSDKEKFYETEINTEIYNLRNIVNSVRKNKGHIEDIEQSLKKLKAKELSYTQYLIERKEDFDEQNN